MAKDIHCTDRSMSIMCSFLDMRIHWDILSDTCLNFKKKD